MAARKVHLPSAHVRADRNAKTIATKTAPATGFDRAACLIHGPPALRQAPRADARGATLAGGARPGRLGRDYCRGRFRRVVRGDLSWAGDAPHAGARRGGIAGEMG